MGFQPIHKCAQQGYLIHIRQVLAIRLELRVVGVEIICHHLVLPQLREELEFDVSWQKSCTEDLPELHPIVNAPSIKVAVCRWPHGQSCKSHCIVVSQFSRLFDLFHLMQPEEERSSVAIPSGKLRVLLREGQRRILCGLLQLFHKGMVLVLQLPQLVLAVASQILNCVEHLTAENLHLRPCCHTLHRWWGHLRLVLVHLSKLFGNPANFSWVQSGESQQCTLLFGAQLENLCPWFPFCSLCPT